MNACECSAGVWAGLGLEQCTAGWIEAFDEFLMATGVDGGGRLVLPSLPDVGSVVVVWWRCLRSGFREGEISHVFPPPNRFDRKLFDRIGCVTARSPGLWHDAGHLYAGSPRMCVRILSCFVAGNGLGALHLKRSRRYTFE